MAVYIPSANSIIPASGSWASGSVQHPALLTVPTRIQTLPAAQPGIDGSLLAPPPSVVAANFCKTWKLNATLSGSSFSLSVSDEMIDVLYASAAVENWTDRISDGGVATFDQLEEDEDDAVSYLSLSVSIGSMASVLFAWGDSKWWPGFIISVAARDYEAGVKDDFGSGGIGSTATTLGSEMGITLTVCGEEIPMYYNTGFEAASITGTITLEPEEYFTVE